MKTLAFSALFAVLPISSLATDVADKATSVHNAVTALDRINILQDDSDFVFDFTTATKTTGAGGALIAANAANFPALIGEGLALTVGQMNPCSINSPHTHPRATEFLLVTKGALSAGFLAENGARFVVNNVTELSATIFPAGSIHFQANYGCDPVQFVAALSNEDPGTLQVAQRFFGLPPDVVGASLGGLGVEEVAHLAALIPDNVIAATQECFTKCGLMPPTSQPTSQQQPRVSGNAFPSGISATTSTSTYSTMTSSSTASTASATSSWPTSGTGKNWDVIVGENLQLTYTPEYVSAAINDTVTFHFVSKNHTATRSSFNDPCSPLAAGGFDSGFHFVDPANPSQVQPFVIPVTDTDPIWVYCRQKNPAPHCGLGMVFAVNPPATGNTFAEFKKKALATANSTATTTTAAASTTAPVYPSQTPTYGKLIDVAVGKDGGLTYEPDDITANVGDIVRFTFVAKNHTVTRSSFNDPCTPLMDDTGFDSGFQPVSDKVLQFNHTVTDDKPIWFYCRQKAPGALSHCQQGMNGAINAPGTGNTLSAFKTRASSSD